MTFVVQGSIYSDLRHPTFIAPAGGDLQIDTSSPVTTRVSNWSLGTTYDAGAFRGRVSVSQADTDLANAGIGGLTTPSAASRLNGLTRRFQTNWRMIHGSIQGRGGISMTHDSVRSTANSAERGLVITGQLVSDGSRLLSDRSDTRRWFGKHVWQGTHKSRPWLIGLEAAHDLVRDSPLPNPLGTIQLASMDEGAGTWMVQRAKPGFEVASATAAAFADYVVQQDGRRFLRAGVRGDWQEREGLLVSPRVAAGVRLGGFSVESNAGLFVERLSSALLMEAALRDGHHMETLLFQNASRSGVPSEFTNPEPLFLEVQPHFARRRDFVSTTTIRRPLGMLTTGLAYTWTSGSALPALTRTRLPAGLVDRLDSDRHLIRHQLHARASLDIGTTSVTGHYEFIRSDDDSDGPFSHPERQQDVQAEWGRSEGVATHNASVVGSWRLPGGVNAYVTATASSGSPYTVITGNDTEGLATYTDRAGVARNSVVGPAFFNAAVFASRRFSIPRARGIAVDVGFHADNLFNRTHALDIGRVAGTAWLGKPMTASPGRSSSVWMTLGR